MNDCLRLRERHAVLRAPRAGERRLDVAEVELDDLRVRRVLVGSCQSRFSLQYASTSAIALVAAAGEAQVRERHVVDGEEAARRAVLGAHVPERRAVGERERRDARAEVLDELPDDADLAQDLRDGQHEVGRGRALAAARR